MGSKKISDNLKLFISVKNNEKHVAMTTENHDEPKASTFPGL